MFNKREKVTLVAKFSGEIEAIGGRETERERGIYLKKLAHTVVGPSESQPVGRVSRLGMGKSWCWSLDSEDSLEAELLSRGTSVFPHKAFN